MNRLPEHRQGINGRTHSQSWSASSFDPISHYRHPIGIINRAAGVALAVVIGIVIGAALGFGVRP